MMESLVGHVDLELDAETWSVVGRCLKMGNILPKDGIGSKNWGSLVLQGGVRFLPLAGSW